MAKTSQSINLIEYLDEKQIKKMVEPELQKIAKDVINDMDYFSFKTIEDFYHDYHPQMYVRRYALYKLWKKPKIKKQDDGYLIEFVWSADGLEGAHSDKYEDLGGSPIPPSERIFNGPFLQGYHGGPIFTPDSYVYNYSSQRYVVDRYHYEPAPQCQPSPWELIKAYAEIEFNAYVEE